MATRASTELSVVVGGKFILRVWLKELRERHGARAVLGFEGFTGPRGNPRGEAGEKIVGSGSVW